jgi:hypothetical protein
MVKLLTPSDPTELRAKALEIIAECRFSLPGLRELGSLLPEDDDELHEWLQEIIAKHDAFIFAI